MANLSFMSRSNCRRSDFTSGILSKLVLFYQTSPYYKKFKLDSFKILRQSICFKIRMFLSFFKDRSSRLKFMNTTGQESRRALSSVFRFKTIFFLQFRLEFELKRFLALSWHSRFEMAKAKKRWHWSWKEHRQIEKRDEIELGKNNCDPSCGMTKQNKAFAKTFRFYSLKFNLALRRLGYIGFEHWRR